MEARLQKVETGRMVLTTAFHFQMRIQSLAVRYALWRP